MRNHSSTTLMQILADGWGLKGHISALGEGHIHDTFLVHRDDQPALVLQRVNDVVFCRGAQLMAQTQRVLDCWSQQSRYRVPNLMRTLAGEHYITVDGQIWRLWTYISESRVIDPVSSAQQVCAVAEAFAYFQDRLRSIPGPALEDTIDGFLQLGIYLDQYKEVRGSAPAALDRLIQEGAPLADAFVKHGPGTTVIHGDCKVNNVLFDEVGTSVVAVIDFDTVMLGHWAWDFGDLVRSVCLSAGGYDLALYQACVHGFVTVHNSAKPNGDTPKEPRPATLNARLATLDRGTIDESVTDKRTIDDYVDSPAYVSLMLGVRFLTDHLSGNKYFRVENPGENLRRAEAQFDLFQNFVAHRAEMLACTKQEVAQISNVQSQL